MAPIQPSSKAATGTFMGQRVGADCPGQAVQHSKITPGGTQTTLYNFCSQPNCTDGAGTGGLVQATDGNFYGTTGSGGANNGCPNTCGTVFQMTPGGLLTTLYSFCSQPNCFDGHAADPGSPPVQGIDGNLYGVNQSGGANSGGTVFKITLDGTLTTLYAFCSLVELRGRFQSQPDKCRPTDENFYGTTWTSGTDGLGTFFKITTSGTLTPLGSVDGYPSGKLIQATDGNFYGTTARAGTIFQMTPTGMLTTLGFVGGYPYAGVIQSTDGNLYGTTGAGGNNQCGDYGCGSVFELTLPGDTH